MSESKNGKFGVNVWWTVPETVTDGTVAQDVVKRHGFEPKKDLPLPSRRAEFSRGVYSLQVQRGKQNRTKVEPVADTPTHVAFGILECAINAEEEAAYNQKTKAVLTKDTDVVTAEGKLAAEVLKAVDAYSGKVTDEDVRYFLRRVIRMCYGVAKRPSGGIYFVPARFSGIVEQAQGALVEIGTGARIYVERVMDGKEERENVWGAVEDEVVAKIEETLAAVGRIEKRAEAVKSQQAKLDELGELVAVYKDLLGEEAKYEGVAERIEEAVKTVAEKMAKLQQGTAASVVAAVNAPENGKGMRVPDAVVEILARAGRSMAVREIFDMAVKDGLYVTDAARPFESFVSVLGKSLAKGEKRLARTGPGVWALAA